MFWLIRQARWEAATCLWLFVEETYSIAELREFTAK